MAEKLIFELSAEGRSGVSLPPSDVPQQPVAELVPGDALRSEPPELPEVSPLDVMRHFIRLSVMNHHIDKGFYPLGSCTMKYNPKINEDVAALPGFARLHPLQPDETVQGAIQLAYELSQFLAEITGMDGVTLQPAAGAQGELTGLMLMRAYHERRGSRRSKIIFPDSAHGTNPASVALAGYKPIQIRSNAQGLVDVDRLRKAVDMETAGIMLTNPNTLGLFEKEIEEIARIMHDAGALLYMDGANLNAMLGITRPGDMGFDMVHINLHKTFSTPHGGGGPGAGAVGVKQELVDFLPAPLPARIGNRYVWDTDRPHSIGRLHSFYGNFGVLVRAYTYIRACGGRGLRQVSEKAILNANYLLARLRPYYDLPQPFDLAKQAMDIDYKGYCQHEFVLSATRFKKQGIRTLDIAKRLLDFGVYAPTVYFPLIVAEALMIEPTETESREAIDAFAEVLIQIAREAENQPERLKQAPYSTPVRRLDEVTAARHPDLRWRRPDRPVDCRDSGTTK